MNLENSQNIFNYISIKETIKEFGYSPNILSKGSNKKIIRICINCKEKKQQAYYLALQNKTLKCKKCFHLDNKIKEMRSVNNKKYLINNPHPRLNKKHTKETKEKQSLSRKGKYIGVNNPLFGRKHSEEQRKQNSLGHKGLQVGKRNSHYGKPAAHGKGEWYTKLNGEKIWLRSSWETKLVKEFEYCGISFTYEPKAFPITYMYEGKLKEGTYTPDFYLPVFDKYVEVKGYWRDDALFKFEAFKEQYPNEKIQLIMKPEMKQLGLV